MRTETYIHTDIDYEKNGKQISFLNLPYSPHTDAWGVIPIPVAVIKNGTGPTALLSGGIHGDEYEGPITLGKLIRELDPAEIQGRLIFIPAANTPAVIAGRRVSPEDGKNMNRAFPGEADGTPTSQIAHYIDSVLFPLCDLFMDLHSGGSSLDLIPAAIMQVNEDRALAEKIRKTVRAFNAPLTVVMDTLGEERTSSAAALRHGIVAMGTEMGSAGAVSQEGLRICERGVRNVLAHFEMIEAGGDSGAAEKPTRMTQIGGPDAYVYAPANGIFQPARELGDTVEAGEIAGYVHFLDDPGRQPEAAKFKRTGMLFCRRAPGLVIRGNCVGIVVNDLDG